MFAFSAVFLLAAFFGYATALFECPPEIITRPCRCHPVNEVLECENITDIKILHGLLKRIRIFEFKAFILMGSKIDFIPSAYLKQKSFAEISIEDSQLVSFLDKVPDESESVKVLKFVNVTLSNGFPWAQLKPLTKLRRFVAVQVNIPRVGQNIKNNLSRDLRQLVLVETNTTVIEDGTLTEHKDLQHLRITNSGLKAVKRNYLPLPAANLRAINFNGNNITDIPNDFFKDMPRLKSAHFYGNKISTVSKEVAEKIPRTLETFSLEGNPLNCDCKLRWILTLKLQSKISGTCASPDSLNGKRLKKLEAEDFVSCE